VRRASGFTLLELLVAIVVAGIVALLVYGTAAAGRETQVRLTERRHAFETAQAFRAMLEDALRNARPSRVSGDTTFWIASRLDARGRPHDRLWFITAGGTPPLTPDADWQISLESDANGVVMMATPVGIMAPTRVVARYPGATGLQLRVLSVGSPPAWLDRWVFPSFAPAAITVAFWSDAGPLGAPYRLAVPLGGSR